MKGERIVRRTLADRKKDRTSWARIRAMTEEEIERGAESDPDNPPWTEEELRNAWLALPASEPKVPLSIRLDREVVEYFKGQGPGYQSRIGAVLLSYVRSQEGTASRRGRAALPKKRASAKKSAKASAKNTGSARTRN